MTFWWLDAYADVWREKTMSNRKINDKKRAQKDRTPKGKLRINAILESGRDDRDQAFHLAKQISKAMREEGVTRSPQFVLQTRTSAGQPLAMTYRLEEKGARDIELYRLIVVPFTSQAVDTGSRIALQPGSQVVPVPLRWEVIGDETERVAVFHALLAPLEEIETVLTSREDLN